MEKKWISRKEFVRRSLFGTGLMLGSPFLADAETLQEKPAPLKPEIVKEFVAVCHSNIARVKEMLENEHLLLHASWDWGGGDFESGIEAAGHVGNREIAEYLLSKGARYNIFLASMLGHYEVVKQVITIHPGLIDAKGAHGFTLLHHANRGGEAAVKTIDLLKSMGAEKTRVDFYERS